MMSEFTFRETMHHRTTKYLDVELYNPELDELLDLSVVTDIWCTAKRSRFDDDSTAIFSKSDVTDGIVPNADPLTGKVSIQITPDDTAGMTVPIRAILIVDVRVKLQDDSEHVAALGLLTVLGVVTGPQPESP